MDGLLGKEVSRSTLDVRSWAHFRLIATTVLDLDVIAFLAVTYRELRTNYQVLLHSVSRVRTTLLWWP